MRNGKYSKRGVASKTLVLVLALVLVVGCAVGGTLAWLTDKTAEVKNTFTTSDINITLEEGKDLDLTMVPGHDIDKDPEVTVESGSEYCWLFVKIEESSTLDTYITYTVDSKWTQGDGTKIPANVWYMEIDTEAEINVPYSVLTNNKVTVKGSVTKEQMEDLAKDGAVQPTLTFTAYASQLMKNATTEFSADEAWHNVSDPIDAVNYPTT